MSGGLNETDSGGEKIMIDERARIFSGDVGCDTARERITMELQLARNAETASAQASGNRWREEGPLEPS
jgi:hypothetical protein